MPGPKNQVWGIANPRIEIEHHVLERQVTLRFSDHEGNVLYVVGQPDLLARQLHGVAGPDAREMFERGLIEVEDYERLLEREMRYAVDPFESGHSIRRGAWDVGYAAGRSAERARWVKLLREEAAIEARAPGHEAAWEALNRCANALGADEEVRDV